MAAVNSTPADLDLTRAAIAAHDLTTDALAFLTYEVAVHLPFEDLGPFKRLLKQFFSNEPWTAEDAAALSDIVTKAVPAGWWEHQLGSGVTLSHGIRDGRYVIWVTGGAEAAETSIFDRIFDGPVHPEPTPHPRKVKFNLGGEPGPSTWHRRTDGHGDDVRLQRLFQEPDITDVMIAGDFVTIGLDRSATWEDRLDPILDLVVSLFAAGERVAAPARTREQLLQEAGHVHLDVRPSELHLLDADDPDDRAQLTDALVADDPRLRRIAVAVLAESSDDALRRDAVRRGYADGARIVRRAAIDAGAETADASLRDLFESALEDGDGWIRWKAVRTLGEIGVGPSRAAVAALENDTDFQVRFEVARALRS